MTTRMRSLGGAMAAPDYRLMRRVHRWQAPRWVRWWMLWATRGGDGWLWGAWALLVLWFGEATRFACVGAAVCAALTGIGLFFGLKRAVGRVRPCDVEPHCWATLLPPDPFSFPSGHSLTAFAIAVPVGLFYPSLLPVLLFCAVSIALSRIVLGMHFLSDVVVGSATGAALGYACFQLFR